MPPTPDEVIEASSAYVNALKAEVERLKAELASEREQNVRRIMLSGPHEEGFS